jgi:hypothetical protein
MSAASKTVTPSEKVTAIAALFPALPKEDAAQLRDLLAHHAAFPTAATVREERLGLLIELLIEGAEVPTADAYDEARAQRIAAGDDRWPHSTTLARSFGGRFRNAAIAAGRLCFEGGTARVPASFAHGGDHAEYTWPEVIAAVRRFKTKWGDWPHSFGELGEWRRLERRHAAEHGLKDPRIPCRKQIVTLIGDSFDRLLELAQDGGEP